MSIDPEPLVRQRRVRLDSVLRERGVPAILTSDPFSIRYATGTRNMLVHNLTGPDRIALLVADGPGVLWEFAGCDHLTAGAPLVDDLREAPALNAKKSPHFRREVAAFAVEVEGLCRRHLGSAGPLGLEGLTVDVADALRAGGIELRDGNELMQVAMAIKQPAEVDAMYEAMSVTEVAARAMAAAIEPGATEQEVWAEFHRTLIARGGELVVSRLLQAGERTFPYFREASGHQMQAGDLVCFDSDAVAMGGYSVDFSRTFLCGDGEPSASQRHLYGLALEQLEHNAENLVPGRSFEEFAGLAFEVSDPYARYGYYQLAHGLGLAGGHPNIPRVGTDPYPLAGCLEPGMVVCVESYVGDPDSCQGVKLENQYLICANRVEQMSHYPMDRRLSGQ